MPFKFCKKAKQVIDLVENSDRSFFVTGKAGTGKSTLLEHIRLINKKKSVVLAPTGISAINVNGETIHSFFNLKPGYEKDEARKMRIDDKKIQKFSRLRTMFIDEISMVRADVFDAMDIVLRRVRDSQLPFGGLQMVLFGDLYQLPPVVTSDDQEQFYTEYSSPYFFASDVFSGQKNIFDKGFDLPIIELETIYRQKDKEFIEVLNAVRQNRVDDNHLQILNSRYSQYFNPPADEKYIYLVTTNAEAKRINEMEMKKLGQLEVEFIAEQEGKVPKSLYPNDVKITLSEGAQVMFICNDKERRWVNGTIGRIKKISYEYDLELDAEDYVITVEKEDKKIVKVKYHTWEISKYVFRGGKFEREQIGRYEQVPLRLAWAITVHKSQGKTFEKVIVDFGRGTFAHGQSYVALSRCTTLAGMVLKRPMTRRTIIMDEQVRNFHLGARSE
ncbi:AAA family ATPase [Candidatus Kuenenbacteria bacterium]|nr:AAA family ATPase [Candidatus Kuenenbacteria bacterium]